VDASPIGLACSLTQTKNGVRRVICFASRTLTPVEMWYCQTEKEALACVYGCEHFRRYLAGPEFDSVTDHQPLWVIFDSPRAKLPAQIERWGLRLMAFKFRVVHVKGNDNISDYLSRHSIPSTSDDRLCSIAEQHVSNVIYGIIFDSKLNIKAHILYLRNKCLKSLNLLKIIAHKYWGANQKTLLTLYRTLFRSKLDYGSFIYGSTRKSYLYPLNTIANQALRICTGAFRTSPITSL